MDSSATTVTKLSRAGLVAPCRFAGFRDTMTDDDGNTPDDPEHVSCALCGVGLRYVVTLTDANGARFDIGKECSKWARLSPAEKKAVATASREARALAAAERAEPGYIARKIAEKVQRAAEHRANDTAFLAQLEEEMAAGVAKLARIDTPAKAEQAADLDLSAEHDAIVARLAERIAQLGRIIPQVAARL